MKKRKYGQNPYSFPSFSAMPHFSLQQVADWALDNAQNRIQRALCPRQCHFFKPRAVFRAAVVQGEAALVDVLYALLPQRGIDLLALDDEHQLRVEIC